MVDNLPEIRFVTRRRPTHAGLRAERPRPSDPGGDEDVPDDQEVESGREGKRESPAEPQRNVHEGVRQ